MVMDLFNREIIGYEVSKQINAELAKAALGNAIGKRGCSEGLIFHSDRGAQYASKDTRNYSKKMKSREV